MEISKYYDPYDGTEYTLLKNSEGYIMFADHKRVGKIEAKNDKDASRKFINMAINLH